MSEQTRISHLKERRLPSDVDGFDSRRPGRRRPHCPEQHFPAPAWVRVWPPAAALINAPAVYHEVICVAVSRKEGA